MSTATLNPGVTIIDDRPLNERLAETLKERKVAKKAKIALATAVGSTVGGGLAYINFLIAMGVWNLLSMPAWFVSVMYYGGMVGLGMAAAWGGVLGYALARAAL